MEGFKRYHKTARAAAEYAEKLSGWKGFKIRRMRNGRFRLTMEWDDAEKKK